MTDLHISVSQVASLELREGGPAELALADGTACRIDPGRPRFELWAGTAADAAESGSDLYVASEPDTGRVAQLARAAAFNVGVVAPDPERGGLEVRFWQRSAIYLLKGDRPGYEATARVLEEAALSHQEVLVSVDPLDLEVLDARSVPPPG
jgi:hypothetical protein